MGDNYCVLCQEDHQMSSYCVTVHAQCKGCGVRGHFRKDCSQQEQSSQEVEGNGINSQETKNGLFVKVKDCITPHSDIPKSEETAGKTKCTGELQKQTVNKYEKPNIQDDDENIPDSVKQLDEDRTSESRGSKRKISDQGSPCCSKSVKLLIESDMMPDDSRTMDLHESPVHESGVEFPHILESFGSGIIRISLGTSESFGDGDTTGNVIYISDDEEDNPDGNDDTSCTESTSPSEKVVGHGQDASAFVYDDQKKVELSCEIQETSPDLLSKYQEQDMKSPELMAGLYTIVCVHLELFRSSRSCSPKLTQLGCVVSGFDKNSFFRAIKPCGIEKYLDHFKLGGDLLQALHMTREDDGTFLFRSRFEVINDDSKIVCIEEIEALESCLDFLQNFPNCIVVGVDEETVAILARKLKCVNREKFIISGFTYWKRILKYLDIEECKSIDLEEYYASLIGKDLPSFNSASDIAAVVLESVKNVTSKEKGGKKSLDANFYKLCKRIECIEHPREFDSETATDVENIEVYSSFRPAVSATISAEKLEEILLSSESDSEPEETGRSQTGLDKHGDEDVEVVGTGEMNEVRNDVGRKKEKRKERRMRMKGRKASKQPHTTADKTGKSRAGSSNQEVKASYVSRKVLPLSMKTLLQKVGFNFSGTVQPNPSKTDTWRIGEPTPKEGTVICPSPKCTRVKYSKIAQHLSNKHPLLVVDSLLCSVCKTSVTASKVRVHMPRCSPGPAKKSKVTNISSIRQLTNNIALKTPTVPTVNSLTLQRSPILTKTYHFNTDRTEIAASALSVAPLPGQSTPKQWSVVEDNTASAPALSALRIVLDSYLMTNFVTSRGGLTNCLRMYKHYQETMKSQGHREVMSSDNFVIAVTELAKARWNIDVGPARVESGQLYFRGFKKFTIDLLHTGL